MGVRALEVGTRRAMTKLWLDLETYSEVPITHGTHAYAAGAEIMLLAWAIDEGPVSVIDFTNDDLIPDDLLFPTYTEVWAHNSHFDRTVIDHAAPWLVSTDPTIWRDTMVQALSHGLPGSLGQLCDILKVPTDKAKDKDGRRLINLFCKPRNAKVRRATRETHPEDWAKFMAYAGDDIVAMREVHRRLPNWNYKGAELALWHLDQGINDRGVGIDLELVTGAIHAVTVAQKELQERTVEMTGGQLESTTQRAAMLEYIAAEYGVMPDDLQMATVERMVEDTDTPPELRALLEVRLQASTSSTSKYKTLLKGTSSDSRLRGTLQFNGAARTGRWAGRLFQPQNLPRPTLKQARIEMGIEAIKGGAADLVFENVMQLTSSAIRSVIVAPKGRKLVVADLSNIEGRDQAWLAGEEWKLQAFTDFDNGDGPDLYKLAYGKTFGIAPAAVTKDQRQVGKVQELALGYEGGVGAFVTFASAYGIDLEQLAEDAMPTLPAWAVDEATGFLEWLRKQNKGTMGLSDDAFIACDAIKRGWRQAHSAISSYWGELRTAAVDAIEHPGITFPCRRVKVRRDGNWLRLGLPSGRAICYPSPGLLDGSITYMGINQYSRQWSRLKTYGGKIFENICQAVARDVMTANMPLIEAAGYQICLTVHDEVICEAPDDEAFNADHLSSLLAANPVWAPDMPLAAAGFEAYRYRKD
jgi:DNA polymerase